MGAGATASPTAQASRRAAGEVSKDSLRHLVSYESSDTLPGTVEGVTGDDVAQAICQATEREGVDLVCLGTSTARGHSEYFGDSVARALVARCRRPVVVLHA